jgi:hypothetical protein
LVIARLLFSNAADVESFCSEAAAAACVHAIIVVDVLWCSAAAISHELKVKHLISKPGCEEHASIQRTKQVVKTQSMTEQRA